MNRTAWAILFVVLLSPAAFARAAPPTGGRTPPWKDIPVGPLRLSFEGSYRARGEIQHEFNINGYATGENEAFLLSRLRLGFDLQWLRAVRTYVQFQDSRVFGSSFGDADFKGSNPYHDDMDIRQAYLDVEPVRGIEFQVGRQQIAFADHRIFGPGSWGNTGRYVWDAGRLRLHNAYVDSHTFAGRFIIRDPDRWPNKHASGPTAFANYTMLKFLPFDLDLFYVLKRDGDQGFEGESGTGDLASHSFGLRVDGDWKGWDFDATAVGQLGRWGADDIRAYGIATRIGYAFSLPWRPHLMAEFVNGSGDANPGDGVRGTFDGVFSGADTVLYGWMNLFFWSNTREYRLELVLTPARGLDLRGEYHYFTLDEKRDAWYSPGGAERRDESGMSGRELGHEVDLTFHYRPRWWFELRGGWAFFVPGEFFRDTGPAPDAQWGFLQLQFYY